MVSRLALICGRTPGGEEHNGNRPAEWRVVRVAAFRAGPRADARRWPRRCPTPTPRSSRWTMRRPPSGTWRTRRGSSRRSCCAITRRATGCSTRACRSCSTAITRPRAQRIARDRARHAVAPDARRGSGLARACRCGDVTRCSIAAGACADLVELGLAHEQQHQELLLTDIKHALWQNPLGPAMWPQPREAPVADARPGSAGSSIPAGSRASATMADRASRSTTKARATACCSQPFALADRLVTNAEWDAFIADGGYRTPRCGCRTAGPGCRRRRSRRRSTGSGDGGAFHARRAGSRAIPPRRSRHISYYEADAFAAWAGARLPTEFEWEAVARGIDSDGRQPARRRRARRCRSGGPRAVRRLLAVDPLGLSAVSRLHGRRRARSANTTASS